LGVEGEGCRAVSRGHGGRKWESALAATGPLADRGDSADGQGRIVGGGSGGKGELSAKDTSLTVHVAPVPKRMPVSRAAVAGYIEGKGIWAAGVFATSGNPRTATAAKPARPERIG
jgi:hypothetical protein